MVTKKLVAVTQLEAASMTRIANLKRRAGLWVSTKFNRASLQILYVHVYAIDIKRKRH